MPLADWKLWHANINCLMLLRQRALGDGPSRTTWSGRIANTANMSTKKQPTNRKTFLRTTHADQEIAKTKITKKVPAIPSVPHHAIGARRQPIIKVITMSVEIVIVWLGFGEGVCKVMTEPKRGRREQEERLGFYVTSYQKETSPRACGDIVGACPIEFLDSDLPVTVNLPFSQFSENPSRAGSGCSYQQGLDRQCKSAMVGPSQTRNK